MSDPDRVMRDTESTKISKNTDNDNNNIFQENNGYSDIQITSDKRYVEKIYINIIYINIIYR